MKAPLKDGRPPVCIVNNDAAAEWEYRYNERIGILVDGDREATVDEHWTAVREANQAVRKLFL